MTASGTKTWRCRVCGYVHEGDAPPDECPLCGAPASAFEPVETGSDDPADAAADEARRVVIVGGGIAAISAAEAARRASDKAEITLLSAEPGLPYNRLNLTRVLAGELKASDLSMQPRSWYEEARITLHTGVRADRLDLEKREVAGSDGGRFAFDKLILATGADAFVPPLPGADRRGVFTLRTREDAEAMLDASRPGLRCVVIGGGILGLETAGALARQKGRVTLLEGSGHLMPRQLSARPAGLLGEFVEELGIRLMTQARIARIAGSDDVAAVEMDGGAMVDADMVVVATGVRSSVSLPEGAGLSIERGVVVDDRLRTSHADVYACGDVCVWKGVQYGSWAAAQAQGTVAGGNAAGRNSPFAGMPRVHTLKVLGLDMVSIGQVEPESDRDHVVEDEAKRPYRRFLLRGGKLVGAILLGDIRLSSSAARAADEQRDLFDGDLRGMTPDAVASTLA